MISVWARVADIACRLAVTCLCACSGVVQASEWTVSGIAGAGNHIDVVGVEAQVPSGWNGTLSQQWSWALNWAGDVAYWRAHYHVESSPSLWEARLTPVVALRHATGSDLSYYVEAGIGVHLVSHTRIDGRVLSTAFQFGELAGAGVNFGDHGQYAIGIRIQHISNGCIKEPNYGVTFGEVRIAYRWD